MDHAALIDEIAALPDKLEAAVAGLTDAQLDTRYREGGWTVRQVVHHVADSHIHSFIRMKFILTEDNPTLKPYNQDVWAVQADVNGMPVSHSLQIIRGLHARWAVLLRAVPASSWGRTAFHPERGTVRLEDLVKIYAGHGEKHVAQITGLRTAKGW
jgi:hypothetical protein